MLEPSHSSARTRVLPASSIILSLLLIVVGLTAGCSKEAKRDRYIERANRYYTAGDYPKATIEYMNALKLDRENLVCVQRLGLIAFAQGQLGRAHAYLSRYHAQKPGDVEVMSRLLRIYRESHDFARGSALAIDLLKIQPTHAEALLTLADFAVTPEQDAELNSRIEKLKQDGSHPAVVQLAMGIGHLKRREFSQAEAALKRAAALDPKSPFLYAALGNYFAMRGDLQSAREQFEKQLQTDPQDLFARVHVAEFRIRTGDIAGGKTELDSISKQSPEFVPVWNQLAAIAVVEQRLEDAESLLGKALAIEPADFQALLLKARLSVATTNLPQAILQFQQLRQLYSKVYQIPLELARVYLATNDVNQALSALDESLALNPGFADAVFLKAQILFRQGDLTAAGALLNDLLQQNPKLVPAQLALAEVHRARGDQNQALQVYQRLIENYPSNAYPRHVQGVAYLEQGKTAEAEMSFRKALEIDPGYLPSLLQIGDVQLQRRDFAGVEDTLNRISTLVPQDANLSLLRARFQIAKGETPAAEASLAEAINRNPSLAPAYELLSRIYIRSNRTSEALANLDATLTRFPGNVAALLQKAVLHEATSNYVAAAAAYERAITNAPTLVAALNNLAYLRLEKLHQPDQAYDLARRARQLAPEEPTIADTFGWAQYHRKEYDQALATLSEAAVKLSRNPEVQFHLGMAHYHCGNETNAAAALRRALELNADFEGAVEARRRLQLLADFSQPATGENLPQLKALLERQEDDPIALGRLAAIQLRQSDWAGARISLEHLVTLTPRSVPALLELAALNADHLGNPRKAFELARQARVVDPKNSEAAHAIGRYAPKCGEYEWALNVLQEQVQTQDAPPGDLLYDFAVTLYAVGRTDDAVVQVRKALAVPQSAARKELAEQFLRFIDASSNPPPAVVAEARNVIATDPGFLPAVLVIGVSQAQSGDASGARQTLAKALEQSPRFAPALRVLVTLPSAGSGDPRMQDWALAARKAFPKDPAVALAAGRVLHGKGDFIGARALLQEAAAALPDNAEAVYYRGMNRLKTGERDKGLEDLKRAVNLGLPSALSSAASKILIDAEISGTR